MEESKPVIIALSARNAEQLMHRIEQLHDYLSSRSADLRDLAFTLQVGREPMAERIALIVQDTAELVDALDALRQGNAPAVEHHRGTVRQTRGALPPPVPASADPAAVPDNPGNLARQWVQGAAVDWPALYGVPRPRRLRLPVYPFARERYWASRGTGQTVTASLGTANGTATVFEETWEVSPADTLVKDEAATVLCLIDGLGAEVQAAHEAFQALVPGARLLFLETGDTNIEDALKTFTKDQPAVDAIWDLRLLSADSSDVMPALHLLRAIVRSGLQCPFLAWAGHCSNDDDQALLEARTGLARSLRPVVPELAAAMVIERADVRVPLASWLERLWLEFVTGDVEDVLYLDGLRHTCGQHQVDIDFAQAGAAFRKGGTYWITGGAGELGVRVARYLAQHYQANLVLSGRADAADRSAIVEELTALGAAVLYGRADVTDRTAMAALLARAKERFGQVDGVIHAAGVAEPEDLLSLDDAAARDVLAGKIEGVRLLEELLADEPLHLMCHFSSLSAVLGDFGSGVYAMANRFLQAHARLSRKPYRQLAIGWPLWREGGMGRDRLGQLESHLSLTGQSLLETEAGLHLLEHLVAGDGVTSPTVIVAGKQAMQDLLAAAQHRRRTRNEHTAVIASSGQPSLAGAGYRPEMKGLSLEQCIIWDLLEMSQQLLGIAREHLDTSANLVEYGFDSVRLIELAKTLSTHYGLVITPAVFFNHPTLDDFATHLLQQHGAHLQLFYQTPQATTAQAGNTARPSFERAPQNARNVEHTDTTAAIAIIGMSGRFPDARDVESFWEILRDGRSVIRPFPEERREAGQKATDAWLGVVPGVDEFDPLFFEMSPREAELTDPRQRLLLQESWRALEDAGYGEAQLVRETIGMFVGVEQGDYMHLVGPQANAMNIHDGILAARLAYILNLHGPTMAINTACSSGLVALHQACQSLRLGECDTALAAGVNLLLTPVMLESMKSVGMLSPDHTCYAFDRRANGMVAGEAVVALVLKPLARAQADGDPIHAVIKASAINHDGKTQGITAPSGTAQAGLLRDLYRQNHIDPAELGHLVSHGTGTPLGDPIEVNALNEVFSIGTAQRQYCALTSVKPNVGHTMAASGLVSLVALIQGMRHGAIPASLNCQQESDYIDWSSSPFYVNREARPWPRPEHPRMGAVSAFGISGTNAHVVIQDVDRVVETPADAGPFQLLVLSAKTPEALRQRIDDLVAVLQAHDWTPAGLRAMSHTLLNGRQHFTHRCAVVIQDRDDAIYVLQQAAGNEARSNLFRGQVSRDFTPSKALHEYAGTLLGQAADHKADARSVQEDLYALADLYCQGYSLDWQQLFGKQPPRRLNLPGYPFAREHYWVAEPVTAQATGSAGAWLHPLVQRNTSDLEEQRYSTILRGDDWFLDQHRVLGRATLPGTAQLELARAAAGMALGRGANSSAIALQRVTWIQPLQVEDRLEVHIALEQLNDLTTGFEIYGESPDGIVVYSRGEARVVVEEAPPVIDIEGAGAGTSLQEVDGLYEHFRELGLAYGERFRCLKILRAGHGRAVAELSTPVDECMTDYLWLPNLLDGALQATAATVEADGPALPFALDSIRAWGPLPPAVRAVIELAEDDTPAVRKWNVSLVDEAGNVRVRMGGFSVRPLQSGKDAQTLLLAPAWEALPVADNGEPVDEQVERWVLLCGVGMAAQLERAFSSGHCLELVPAEGTVDQRYAAAARNLLDAIRAIADEHREQALIQLVVPEGEDGEIFLGLDSMLRSAQQEYMNLRVQTVRITPADGGLLIDRLNEAAATGSDVLRISPQGLEQRSWKVLPDADAVPLWEDAGVYWITGGLGGLGRLFARAICREVRQPVLILTGRSIALETQNFVDELRERGATVEIRAVNVSDLAASEALVGDILQRHGRLDGVIHAAGVLHDHLLNALTADDLEQVLAPKVKGLAVVDEVTRNVSLKWLLLCSSITGTTGNVGQAAYAAANGFLDGFARLRQARVERGERFGRTLSVAWPLWLEGGMQVEEKLLARFRRLNGVELLPTGEGLAAVARINGSREPCVVVLHGDRQRLMAQLQAPAVPARQASPATAEQGSDLHERAVRYFKRLLAGSLKLPVSRIDERQALQAYGIDSVMVLSLTRDLEEVFGALPATLFFEYQTIEALTGYFLQYHAEHLTTLLGTARLQSPESEAVSLPSPSATRVSRGRRKASRSTVVRSGAEGALDIAIIGLSGRYPGAQNPDMLWQNLAAGRDSITEIPPERWNWHDYFDTRKGIDGKSYSKWGGFLDKADCFDPLFFSISPLEAERMDPQERLFLQSVYHAIEDAGYTRNTLAGDRRVGVYAGVMYQEYQLLGSDDVLAVNSNASIANRVSYFCNFQGPSLTLDTMCSSSLTAIHLACRSLRQGECSVAIAGGVNLSLHPHKYLMLAQGRFVSSDGRCASFGEGGDGYVPGEGVGAVVLKPLEQAIADGDHIHGVIKGSAVNHGGKTNGYTVPNPQAQGTVIEQALKESAIQARAISYLEAHGTGTALGDPIEMAGLVQAFGKHTQEKQYCAIGSVKSNIGHCESAAGVAGLTKVLLQMKHGELAPSLHSETLNPHIDFSVTPFIVQRASSPWLRPVIDGREYPRIAGLSSFGAGGSNAHLIIEEYRSEVDRQTPVSGPVIIVLSARDESRLQTRIEQLTECLSGHEVNLVDLAYTLQVGREAMHSRVALVVDSQASLLEKLGALRDGAVEPEGCYRGETSRSREVLGAFAGDDDLQEAITHWIRKGKLEKLAELWVQGLEPDWQAFYTSLRPQRLSLPGYPFAEERYWVAVQERTSALAGDVLHPLLHRNTSDIDSVRYTTRLSGDEWFLGEHQVKGQAVVPGVVQLEWARAAVAQALHAEHDNAVSLAEVVWMRPLMVASAMDVHITLEAVDDEYLAYEIHSEDNGEKQVYSQGYAHLRSVERDDASRLDLQALIRDGGEPIEQAPFYERLQQAGLHYGAGLRCVQCLWRTGHSVLVRLHLEDTARQGDYTWMPGLLDGALQGGAVLLEEGGLALPFSLDSLTADGSLPATAWALLEPAADDTPTTRKWNIYLADEEGTVVLQMSGLNLRALQQGAPTPETLVLIPGWREQSFLPDTATAATVAERWLLYVGDDHAELEADITPERFVRLRATEGSPASRYAELVGQTVRALQHIVSQHGSALIQLVIPGQDGDEVLQGLNALLRSVGQEYSSLLTQTVVLAETNIPELASWLHQDATGRDSLIRYSGQGREVFDWSELPAGEKQPLWHDSGVYWITGGLGGLGRVFARAIADECKNPVLLLTGRSTPTAEHEAFADQLRALGVTIELHALDATDASAVSAFVQDVMQRHGMLHGVIHSAGVLRDRLLKNISDEVIQQILAPKVAGLEILDEATRDIPLEWLLLCSSISGMAGNIGQGIYAAANGFLDGFAHHRQARVERGERHGRTLSLGWPLWAEGGMRMSEEMVEFIRLRSGMEPLPTAEGLNVLSRLQEQGADHVVVLHGMRSQLLSALQAVAPAAPSARQSMPQVSSPVPATTGSTPAYQLEQDLAGLMAAHLKLPRDAVEHDTPFTEFGFDSVLLTTFGNLLAERYGLSLSPTVFFEAPTLTELAKYLTTRYPDAVAATFKAPLSPSSARPAEREGVRPPQAIAGRSRPHRHHGARLRSRAVGEQRSVEPIAIIGISGRFPQSEDIQALWDNLRNGRDCIGQLPEWRWGAASSANPVPAGVLDEVDCFDSLFFNISPREALAMDPQQRLLMEYVYRVIEDAGYSVRALSGSNTALLVGTGNTGYAQLLAQAQDSVEGYSAVGTVASMGPNRMSYWLNWHGPSEPIETACSSSLVAIHRAVALIRSGQCEQAVVGGINTLLSATVHESFRQAGMLSPDGHCKVFSADADGYVRGEGVGMLFLKPLSAAERDGDHIYGLVRGSAENHGGRAASLTAPNPNAQARVIESAFRQAGIDPATVGYMEAHGTGTALGDPIEIQGLKQAFETLAQGGAPTVAGCGLGTIKSNIGHLEMAAGVAGVIKVLLQMRHGELVASLNSMPVNRHIELDNTPFRIVTENQPWPRLQDAAGSTLPRRAGVSSFGFGGVNAHVVLEEYLAPKREETVVRDAELIILSARDEERLKERVQQLYDHLQAHTVNLADLAHTLQTGREPMASRLAVVASSQQGLQEKLADFLSGNDGVANLYRGQVARGEESLTMLHDDEDLQHTVAAWIGKGRLDRLAGLWVRGLNVDWQLYADRRARRLSLPSYPFARQRLWPGSEMQVAETKAGRLHPLLHRNTSTGQQIRYSSTFTGKEWFLRDHVVGGRPVMPGVVLLEWARAAVMQTLAEQPEEVQVALEQVVWLRPLVIDRPCEVHITLEVREEGGLRYEIHSDDPQGKPCVYGHGVAITDSMERPQPFDLEQLRASGGRTLDHDAVYARFSDMGLRYGSHFRTLQYLTSGDGYALGVLNWPDDQAYEAFAWLPGVFDGALQSCAGLVDASTAALPFTLQAIRVWEQPSTPVWVVVKPGISGSAATRVVDISIVDGQGAVLVQLTGLLMRTVSLNAEATRQETSSQKTPLAVASSSAASSVKAPPSGANGTDEPTASSVMAALSHWFSEHLNLPLESVEVETPFNELGADSILATSFIRELNMQLGLALSPALLMEYSTIQALTDYLLREHPEVLQVILDNSGSTAELPPPADAELPQEEVPKEPAAQIAATSLKESASLAEPIAIIGISGNFAQSPGIEAFWENLCAGADCIEEVPAHRWSLDDFYVEDMKAAREKGLSYSKWGGFITRPVLDASYAARLENLPFRISDEVKALMGSIHDAVTSAGYSADSLSLGGRYRVGTYVGATFGAYRDTDGTGRPAFIDTLPLSGMVSRLFGFTGPSITQDTLCSSAMSALHTACAHIASGECDVAVVGGVFSLNAPLLKMLCQTDLLAKHPGSRSFSEGRDGTVLADGASGVIVKRLSCAVADGDEILAVIRSGVAGYVEREGDNAASISMLSDALTLNIQRSGIDPRTIGYVGAAAAGFPIADAVEVAGLARAFSSFTGDRAFCALGSAQVNIGHAGAATGLSELAKVVMQMRHGKLVPYVPLEQGFGWDLGLENSPFYMQQTLQDWERPVVRMNGELRTLPRRAMIDSSGYGGLFVSFIVEEYEPAG